MIDPSSDSLPQQRNAPSIYLDYGADEHDCTNQGFEICERGMRFNARWQFSVGTQLAVSFSFQDASGKISKVTTEGIIVDCDLIACKCYQTTLLFIELPEELRAVVKNANPLIDASVPNEPLPRTIRHKASLN